MTNAKAMRAAIGVSDNLRTLYLELLRTGHDEDANAVLLMAGDVAAMLGRIVMGVPAELVTS